MLNKDIKDEFHYGLNDISKYREIIEDKPNNNFDCFSIVILWIEAMFGIMDFFLSLFKK